MKNEIKIALTAIAAVALLIFGINYLKGVNILAASNTYYVKLKDAQQLAIGNQIFANGYSIGTITGLEFDYQNNESVVAAVKLDDNIRLPKGTRAELISPLMGGVVMNLILGPNPADVLSPRDTIIGGPHLGALDKASDMMPMVEAMLPKLDSILSNINRITANPALQQTLENAAIITENLKHTSARLDQMMAGQVPQTLNNVETLTGNLAKADIEGTVQNLNGTITDAQQLVGQLQQTMAEVQRSLNGTESTLGALMNDRSLYDNLNHTVQSADSLVIDLKAHPKRYVHFSIFGKKDK